MPTVVLSTFRLKGYKCVHGRGRRLHTFPAPSTLPSFSSLFMPSFFRASFLFLSILLFGLVSASRINNRASARLPGLLQPLTRNAHTPRKISRRSCRPSLPAMTASCFPAYGFQMPSDVPVNMDGWWCNPADEYAFLGFSYEITLCELLTFRIFSGAPWFMHLPFSRSEFIPATKGFCGHPKHLQQSLRSPLRGV